MEAKCKHNWRLGPVADHLARHCQAVCLTCWSLESLPYAEACRWPAWTDADYEANKSEVERRFFGGHSTDC